MRFRRREDCRIIFFRRGQREVGVDVVIPVVPVVLGVVVVFALGAVLGVVLAAHLVRRGGVGGFCVLTQTELAREHLATLETLQHLLRLGLGIVLKQNQQVKKIVISTKPITPPRPINFY